MFNKIKAAKISSSQDSLKTSRRNILLKIEYDGSNYCGWQVQSHKPEGRGLASDSQSQKKPSIQEKIEKSLKIILQEKVKLICAGRTDAGVHAEGQVANFKTHSKISQAKLIEALNALLPPDIAISKIQEVGHDFHSRFSAKAKVYRYTILNSLQRSAILRNRIFFCRYPLDIKLMRKEARVLLGRHDFSGFCASAGKSKNPLKTVKRIKIARQGNLINIEIEADGFLYNMVRNIVGTLIEVGRGRFPTGTVREILRTRDRKRGGPTAPAHGLCLMEVKY